MQITDNFEKNEFDFINKVKVDNNMTWAQFLMKAAQLMKVYPECMPLPQKLTEAGFQIEDCEDEVIYHLFNFIYEWSLSVKLEGQEIVDIWFYDKVAEDVYDLDQVPEKIRLVAKPYLKLMGKYEEPTDEKGQNEIQIRNHRL